MELIFPENGRLSAKKRLYAWYPIGRSDRESTAKTTWIDEVHGIRGEMRLTEKYWRDRDKKKKTRQNVKASGRCENIYNFR